MNFIIFACKLFFHDSRLAIIMTNQVSNLTNHMRFNTSKFNNIIPKHYLLLIYLFLGTFLNPLYAIDGISILASRDLLESTLVQSSVDDCIKLLEAACDCTVKINDRNQEILLELPDLDVQAAAPKSTLAQTVTYPYLDYPEHSYTWVSERKGKQIHLMLSTQSIQGISYGLYGLLQEQLWFAFYHPKASAYPDLRYWPLTENFTWTARPRFDKKGFHLHTMHPLELTEALLDPSTPDGVALIKEYINWLARNQQNYFEFNLLETENLAAWVQYIKPAVEYAQSRGILVGVDLSLHMTQQKAFMLYENIPNNWKGAKEQIKQNLATLFAIKWDVIAMEASTTEFTAGNLKRVQELRLFVTDLVVNTYGATLAGREHVVKKEEMLGKSVQQDTLSKAQKDLDANRATFIHTVMFYGLTDKKAPVYQNENLLHMLDLLQEEQQVRETWYYPESAYWITFDNSVPMLLLPYLEARLADIMLMDSLNVAGHLTFSSGWEWGHWLIDWSIARWSWEHSFNGRVIIPNATQCLATLFENGTVVNELKALADLQQDYIKDRELIRYMVAQTVTDELPLGLSLELHPQPHKSYRWLRKKANEDDLLILRQIAIDPLLEFSQACEPHLLTLQDQRDLLPNHQRLLLDELINGLEITSLRARHRAQTLSFLSTKRQHELNRSRNDVDSTHLQAAIATRQLAQQLVEQQEQLYRYPIPNIARKLPNGGSTSYDFGYLYPTHNLHFWHREEQQLVQDKYGPFFMSIWDVPRILGLVD